MRLQEILVYYMQEPGGSAAVQQCILHMAMSEMTKLRTPPNIAINEVFFRCFLYFYLSYVDDVV